MGTSTNTSKVNAGPWWHDLGSAGISTIASDEKASGVARTGPSR